MLRVKIPQGCSPREQLDALADVAERYSRGFGHITTRQNIQFHFVKLHDVEPAMRRLAEAGLTTREACGNSVRNITACPYAGVAADELLRRHAVRRGDDALSSAPSAQLDRCRASSRSRSKAAPTTTRLRGDQRHRLPARDRPGRRSRLPRHRRRRHGDHLQRRPGCSTSSCRPPRCCASRRRSLRVFQAPRRLRAQAAQPDEVPDQVARAGRAGARSTSSALTACRARRRCRAADRSAAPPSRAPDWEAPRRAVGRGDRRRRVARSDGARARASYPTVRAGASEVDDRTTSRWRATNVRAAEAVRLS